MGSLAAAASMAAAVASCEAVRQTRDDIADLTSGTPLVQPEPDVRVRVGRGVQRTTIGGPEVVILMWAGETMTAATPVVIDAAGASVQFRDGAGVARRVPAGAVLEIRPPTEASYLRVTGSDGATARYPGVLHLHPATADRMDVVADMAMETYLPGVLAKELPRDWSLPAFQAQAVAARTYAMHERSRAREAGRYFDLESTTADQVFGGKSDVQTADDAVFSTRGQVLYVGREPLRAYYSSTCGGRSATASEVWEFDETVAFNAAAPLQGRAVCTTCEASPLHRWERTRTADEARARLVHWGKQRNHPVADMGKPMSIRVAQVNGVGRPDAYNIIDDRGRTFRLRAEELRWGLNAVVAGQPPITRENQMPSNDMIAEVTRAGFVFRGRGFGHGVGMCQFGAQGQAEEGATWRQIVAWYYPGAEVRRAW